MLSQYRLMIVDPDDAELETALLGAEGVPVVSVAALPVAQLPADISAVLVPYRLLAGVDILPSWTKRVALIVFATPGTPDIDRELWNKGAQIVSARSLAALDLRSIAQAARRFAAMLRERDHLQAALARIDQFGRQLSLVESPGALLERIPSLLQSLLPFDVLLLWDITEKDLRLFLPYMWSRPQVDAVTKQARQFVARQPDLPPLPAMSQRHEFDPVHREPPAERIAHHLISRVGTQRSVFAMFRTGDLPFAAYDGKLFDLAANLITSALANARLFERLEQQSQKIILKNRELLTANRMKTNFIANTSHELKTPLHSILGLTELLVEADDADELSRMAGRINVNARRLLETVNDLLDYSQILSDRVEVFAESFALRPFLHEMLNNVRDLAEVKGLALALEIDDDLKTVATDREKLYRILINLLSNAIKFTPAGKVLMLVNRQKETIQFHVTDTGIGIAKDQLTRIFEQFHRVRGPLHEAQEGTGLGLTIAQSLANMLGGVIRVLSTPGVGSTFTLTLPLAPPPSDNDDIPLFGEHSGGNAP
ncbi:MAG TPA: HAMP domain-containing sensor histidine kinase [bacterium]|nr:HAMP domain-containing sensor histidine kinase [bacterium]